MKKDLNYYMSLDYGIEITPIPKDEGGGFVASIPQLGKYAFIGGGKTRIEALKDLEETKKEYFKEYIKKKIDIPEPEEPKREFRGAILIRIPTFLHESIYAGAKENNVSLNQYINNLLTKSMTLDSLEKKIEEMPTKISKTTEANDIMLEQYVMPNADEFSAGLFNLEKRRLNFKVTALPAEAYK